MLDTQKKQFPAYLIFLEMNTFAALVETENVRYAVVHPILYVELFTFLSCESLFTKVMLLRAVATSDTTAQLSYLETVSLK